MDREYSIIHGSNISKIDGTQIVLATQEALGKVYAQSEVRLCNDLRYRHISAAGSYGPLTAEKQAIGQSAEQIT